MAWIQLHITTSQANADTICAALEKLNAVAVTYQDNADEPILEPLPGSMPLWQTIKITGLFPDNIDTPLIISQLLTELPFLSENAIESELLAERRWEREWMKEFHATRFGKRLWIIPSWQLIQDNDAINIFLDPGLAFGTGTHPTTSLCLEWLDKQDLTDKVVIDFGCGSGILAIAAHKLGARHVFAIDIDPQALYATSQNALKNHIDKSHIQPLLPEQLPKIKVDIIIANILANPLQKLAEKFADLLNPNGLIAISGILESQLDEMLKAYQPWFDLNKPVFKSGWVLLTGRPHKKITNTS